MQSIEQTQKLLKLAREDIAKLTEETQYLWSLSEQEADMDDDCRRIAGR